MSEKVIKKLKTKIALLEDMLEDKTRALYLEKEKIDNYSSFTEGIIHSMNDIIIAVDVQGRIELINEVGLNKLLLEQDNHLTLSIRDVLGDENVDLLISKEEQGVYQIEAEIPSKVKTIPVLISRKSYLKSKIAEEAYIYSITDLSKIKEKESLIEEQKLLLIQNSQLASLGEMASGIAHEINNPITIIDGQLRRLKDYLIDSKIDEEEKVKLTDKIQKNVLRVVEIVNGIRKMSKDGKNDSITSIDLSDVFDTLKNLSSEKFKNDKLMINFQIENKNLRVMSKESELLQILFNLITNGRDAIIESKTKWINVNAIAKDSKVLIRVTDSGKGIPDSVINKIFIPFFSTKKHSESSGIGLSISKKMVTSLGGTLEYNYINGNTSFLLTLPIG